MIFNVTYLKSKIEIKGVSDINSTLNLETMRNKNILSSPMFQDKMESQK